MNASQESEATIWPEMLSPPDAVLFATAYGFGVTEGVLANWRSHGRRSGAPAPIFHKARTGAIRYPRDELIAWLRDELGPAVRRIAELPPDRQREAA